MGRNKGSKNKSSQVVDTGTDLTNVASEEANTVVNNDNNTTLGYEGEPEIDTERAAIYAEYDKQNNTETVPEETVSDEKKSEDVISDATPVEAATETDVSEVVATEDKKKEETKTVPYDALHEEREKRKLAQAKARELEDKLKEMEARIALSKLVEQDNEYLTDDDIKLKKLERSIAELEEKETKRDFENRQMQERTAREQLNKNLVDTDKALTDEGYPGFQFLSSRVGDELNKLVAEDPDNIYLDAPDGWKKIYKEKVFPTVKGVFAQVERQGLMDKKTVAKEGAALVGSPGSADKKPEAKKDDGWTIEEYLEDRRKNSIV